METIEYYLVAAQTHPSPGKYTVRWCAMRLAKYFSRSKHNPWYVTINMVFYGLEQNNCNFSKTLFLEFDNITSHAGVIPCNYFSPMDWYICSYVIFKYVPCAQTLRRHRVDKWRTIYAANVVTTLCERWRDVVKDQHSSVSLQRPHNVEMDVPAMLLGTARAQRPYNVPTTWEHTQLSHNVLRMLCVCWVVSMVRSIAIK